MTAGVITSAASIMVVVAPPCSWPPSSCSSSSWGSGWRSPCRSTRTPDTSTPVAGVVTCSAIGTGGCRASSTGSAGGTMGAGRAGQLGQRRRVGPASIATLEVEIRSFWLARRGIPRGPRPRPDVVRRTGRAHGYFPARVRRAPRPLDAGALGDLVALCQFLPRTGQQASSDGECGKLGGFVACGLGSRSRRGRLGLVGPPRPTCANAGWVHKLN